MMTAIKVFPNSNHQLCKFHKLKNLMDKILKSYSSPKEKKRMIKLAKGIFANKSYYGRKRAAKHLMDISPKYISKYVEKGYSWQVEPTYKRLYFKLG